MPYASLVTFQITDGRELALARLYNIDLLFRSARIARVLLIKAHSQFPCQNLMVWYVLALHGTALGFYVSNKTICNADRVAYCRGEVAKFGKMPHTTVLGCFEAGCSGGC